MDEYLFFKIPLATTDLYITHKALRLLHDNHVALCVVPLHIVLSVVYRSTFVALYNIMCSFV